MGQEGTRTQSDQNYSSGDVATMIGIGATTVRKYALQLEKEGYHFSRSSNNARLFTSEDIMAVRYLKELREKTNITVEQAAAIVCEKFAPRNDSLSQEKIDKKSNDQDFNELKQLIHQQNELLENLVQLLNRQQQYIDDQLMIRDRSLMHSINEKLEAQKLAAATEEAEITEKQSLFSKVFKIRSKEAGT